MLSAKIFIQIFMNKVKNGTFVVKESRLRVYGRCFTVAYTKPVAALELVKLDFKGDRDILLAVHGPGDDLWLFEGIFPVFVQINELRFGSSESIVAVDLHLEKTIQQGLKSDTFVCKTYDKSE